MEEVPLDITILIGAKKRDPMELISINNSIDSARDKGTRSKSPSI